MDPTVVIYLELINFVVYCEKVISCALLIVLLCLLTATGTLMIYVFLALNNEPDYHWSASLVLL